ncbi:MAG: FtsX-like permease family protein, partial [Gemmatimonadaceae bacterium]
GQSTREIGVRVALGAARSDVVRLVMQKGVVLSAAGLVIGVIASMWGARLLDHTLYGISRTDPVSYIIGATLLLMIAVGACVAPTLRAVRIDPMLAMRSE